MPLEQTQILEIEGFLRTKIRQILKNKILKKNKEPDSKPFHERLIGKERLMLFSFIQGLNTSFGSGIFESVAVILAKSKFSRVEKQAAAGNFISAESFKVIQDIITSLTNASGSLPNKTVEIERIREVSQTGNLIKVNPTKVDVYLETFDNELFLIDFKTVKPNVGDFIKFKRMLLEWVATTFAANPDAKVNTLIAIPYNPYDPKPYNRWTMRGMLDLEHEIKVAEEIWDFLGGEGAYQDLLDIFERVGIELRSEIDDFFDKLV